ncbi:GNAT family N-acetyltransferase [Motilibacter sp. E257]|uniref:GNAT family N-acetyltransferase n=2 Tax=Motilibacter deserti TaxID=2714956 RepID=A0ABX0GSM5_9ACTN|nr:GNAT family N-acetyltransferase [Motilibacter deserti]NHC13777.1 GNAT family N-acetyltransferase [Motilibacter deserti]
MLADTPLAFTETLEQSRAFDEREWRRRARRGSAGRGVATFAARDAAGRWVGTMGGVIESAGQALLVSVFVVPEHRGGGVADLLLDEVLRWAHVEAGATRIRLLVHEANPRAAAFYARQGFVRTGRTEAYPLDPTAREVEMARPLGAGTDPFTGPSTRPSARPSARPAMGLVGDTRPRYG